MDLYGLLQGYLFFLPMGELLNTEYNMNKVRPTVQAQTHTDNRHGKIHFLLCLGAEGRQVFFPHKTFIHYANEVAAQLVSRRLPTSAAQFRSQVLSCEFFVLNKMQLGQVFSKCLGFS
jgi:hypothetical protein